MFQKLVIVGRLGRDPELRYMPDGTGVCNISVAVDGTKKIKGGGYEKTTTWFSVSVWGQQGEHVSQYLTKGSEVIVDGVLDADEYGNPPTWTNRNGEMRAQFKVRAKDVRFGAKSNGNGGGNAPAQDEDEDEDAPF